MTKLVRFYLEKKINTKFRVMNETHRLYNNKSWLNKIIIIFSDKFNDYNDFEVNRKIVLTVFPELASKPHNKYCRL